MTVKIEAKDLTKVYPSRNGPVCALRDFSLRVEEGEFVCIVGPSGCGKSTFLRILGRAHHAEFRPGRTFPAG